MKALLNPVQLLLVSALLLRVPVLLLHVIVLLLHGSALLLRGSAILLLVLALLDCGTKRERERGRERQNAIFLHKARETVVEIATIKLLGTNQGDLL